MCCWPCFSHCYYLKIATWRKRRRPEQDDGLVREIRGEIEVKIQNNTQVELQQVTMEGSSGCQVRWLLSRDEGAPNFAMRQFEVEPGGFTPRHHHPYEHEIFVLEGEGEVLEGEQFHSIRAGDVILVKPDEVHQFRNSGNQPLKFLCLIPNSADNRQGTSQPECRAVASQ
jgi:quercetin dioxygenase-like cupin family protein